MAFTLPSFNLGVNIWHNWATGVNAYAFPDLITFGNLSPGRRVMAAWAKGSTPGGLNYSMELLLPFHTDIRCNSDALSNDYVEAPKGTGCLYAVEYVDDIGKGFANEHRIAFLRRILVSTTWAGAVVIPVPWPKP